MTRAVSTLTRRFSHAAAFTLLAVTAACHAQDNSGAKTAPLPPPGVTAPDANARPVAPTKETRLFNGKDFTGWYTFLTQKKLNNDPEHIFTIEPGGVIHVLGKEFGYFATAVPYANYRLTFEVKWGEKKWPPRDKETTPRDSGVLVHCIGKDVVWPQSFECQIQENDMGDIFLLGGISAFANGQQQNGRVVRKKANEKPRGQWNTIEIICKGDTVTNIVNGMVENEATQLTRAKNGTGGRLNFGRIAFQSEGAEVFYRNIIMRPVE